MCALRSMCLKQNIEFHGYAISGAVGVACVAICDDNADAKIAKSPLFRTFEYWNIIWIVNQSAILAGTTVWLNESTDFVLELKYPFYD